MKIATNCFLLTMSILIFSGCVSKQENNWPQFRGTNSLGIAPESATPPLELNPDKNLAWKIPLTAGLSSPCIFAGRIFLTGFNPVDSGLITYCIDRKTGLKLWERAVFPDSLEFIHNVNSYTSTTPATDGTAVYVYFGSYGVVCYDFEGKLIWDHRLQISKAQWGSGASPIVLDSLLIINRDDKKKQTILAINSHTGKTEWEHFLDIVPGNPLTFNLSSATPVIWRDQVIIHRAFELNSINLIDGSMRWSIRIVSEGISTPVILNDILFVNGYLLTGESRLYDKLPDFDTMIQKYDTNLDKLIQFSEIPSEWAFFRRPEQKLIQSPGFDSVSIKDMAIYYRIDSNKDNALGREEWNNLMKSQSDFTLEHAAIAIKLDGSGGSDRPVILWKEKEYVSEVPSLLVVDDKVYMVMNGGTLSCINAKTGKVVFRERLGTPGPYLASPLYANGFIYFASYNGKITVIKPGDKLNIISHSDLHERIAASPVALDNMLYIRTDSALYAFKK
jgi:outer membrane protein assembly factor BamB